VWEPGIQYKAEAVFWNFCVTGQIDAYCYSGFAAWEFDDVIFGCEMTHAMERQSRG